MGWDGMGWGGTARSVRALEYKRPRAPGAGFRAFETVSSRVHVSRVVNTSSGVDFKRSRAEFKWPRLLTRSREYDVSSAHRLWTLWLQK